MKMKFCEVYIYECACVIHLEKVTKIEFNDFVTTFFYGGHLMLTWSFPNEKLYHYEVEYEYYEH